MRDNAETTQASRPTASPNAALLRVWNVSKTFDGVTVLDEVGLALHPGRIHALLGANGAGKSTLVKILTGFYTPDPESEGEISGVPIRWPVNPAKHGIAVVHQEVPIVDSVSIAENLALGSRIARAQFSLFRWRTEIERAKRILETVHVHRDPRLNAGVLTAAEKALITVARAIADLRQYELDGLILFLDEPTAFLSQQESRRFLQSVTQLARDSNVAVVLVSHRLSELQEIADDVTILRDGRIAWTGEMSEIDTAGLLDQMFGTRIVTFKRDLPDIDRRTLAPVLELQNLSAPGIPDLSFTLHAGEILGVTGLAGMGQDVLPYRILGAVSGTGRVAASGEASPQLTPRNARSAGISLVAGNRSRDVFWLGGTAQENVTAPWLREVTRHGWLSRRRERELAQLRIDALGVVPPDPDKRVGTLSGGNQQKLSLARWSGRPIRVLLVHEPTQGIDVAARLEVMKSLTQAASEGTGILLCAADYEALAAICDRVLVLDRGTIAAELTGADLTEDQIAEACISGGGRHLAQPGGPPAGT